MTFRCTPLLTCHILLDKDNQIFPNDEFSNNGADPEATPIPESTSGYGSSTADLLDQISPEPTQDPDTLDFGKETFTVFSQTDMTAQIMRKHRPMFAPPLRVTGM